MAPYFTAMSEVLHDSRRDHPSSSRHAVAPARIVVVVLVGVLLVALGYMVGVRTPWTAHHAHAVTGTAWRMSADLPVAFFDPGNGDLVQFRLDDVPWRSGERDGMYRVPPCLRTPEERVEVEVRAIEVKAASGSSEYLEILSVACPTR
jgi:hypothetical protein